MSLLISLPHSFMPQTDGSGGWRERKNRMNECSSALLVVCPSQCCAVVYTNDVYHRLNQNRSNSKPFRL
uniref:Uncharacterized protein n=1 Tax=Anguilla anguilla TaxID=7936 RepID=A0A0E9U7M7_ANGAN